MATAEEGNRKRLWWLVVLWLGAIYSTLYVARMGTDWLRGQNLLRIFVWTVFATSGLVAVWLARRARLDGRQLAVAALAGAVIFLLARRIPQIEERLHFVEYGVLAGLLYAALSASAVRPVWLWASLGTAVAGLGDEWIQHVLPNRYFGWNDVWVNAVAGVVVATAFGAIDWLARRGQPVDPGPESR